ncbi:MAG: aminopeptidase [Tannerellaceae bacterium]|nr:aminopeptidase [Tannerellaceae bacterium]
MTRTLFTLSLSLLLSLNIFAATELKAKLEALENVSRIEALESSFAEKYVFRVTQPLDHNNPEAGKFDQRVVVCHVGFDRPTVIVTEGYGGRYALTSRYREELSALFDANIVFVEHRYFLESTPEPLDWTYLTAQNSAFDLHHVRSLFRDIYPGKWISTGISKGGQTAMIYRTFFPDDVDISVPYVAPLCRGVEDGRHEPFLRKVGTRSERRQIRDFQIEALKRKATLVPMLEKLAKEKQMTFRAPMAEIFDYCVLEYSFAFWQWGTSFKLIPPLTANDSIIFEHLVEICDPDYFSDNQSESSFFVQAARELGYYGYELKPFRKYLSVRESSGYLARLMVPQSALPQTFDPALYNKIYNYLKENDPKMIFIYGEIDPWSAVHAPRFRGKVNQQLYFQPRGSHRTRINTMPNDMKQQIIAQITEWLTEK